MNRTQNEFRYRWWMGVLILSMAWLPESALAVRDAESLMARTQRNPFALPSGVYYKAPQSGSVSVEKEKEPVKQKDSVETPPLTLQAVVWGGPRPVAVINDGNYMIGDSLNGHEIVDIGRDAVVLMGAKKSRTLELQPSPLAVKRTLP
ncbi:hypothetical protein [Nitrospina watsonii]|uniref:Type II secretion system protein GspC N-terminal domain-containing protein n=1 Tax=Nitrospina watsonii TaxID=1323948 RepID=A0ABN8W2L1_9BACT|nr:hypothetical protein [Nitrospina watsonii]CAI2719244.1 conserved protein of unknown function [Nitrospina watsonii]